MTSSLASPRRCTGLRAAAVLVTLAVSALLAGCGPGAAPAPTAAPSPAAPTSGVAARTVVMVIRHGEKPDGSEPGVDAEGNKDDSSLTEVGWERAHRLVNVFDPASGSLRPGLARPAVIYAAGVTDDGEGQRTRETVAPLAERLGIPVNTDYGRGQEEKLVEQVVAGAGPTLISWQHGGITDVADAFPGVSPKPPADWPDDRFDVIWTFTRTGAGWQFAQLPELALPQDQATVIKN
jgi:broad specificity phosphatase PhoE